MANRIAGITVEIDGDTTQLGWDLDDVTAALMVMADSGSKGGEAGTALNSIMTRLENNTSGCADVLHEYGIEVYDDAGQMNDLGDILLAMQDIWDDLTDVEKANLAYTVAGKNAESELMAVLGDSTGGVLDNIESVADSIHDALVSDFEFPEWDVPELALANAGTTTTNNNRTTNLGGIQIVVNGYNVQNDDQLADMVAAKINDSINREEAVFR